MPRGTKSQAESTALPCLIEAYMKCVLSCSFLSSGGFLSHPTDPVMSIRLHKLSRTSVGMPLEAY